MNLKRFFMCLKISSYYNELLSSLNTNLPIDKNDLITEPRTLKDSLILSLAKKSMLLSQPKEFDPLELFIKDETLTSALKGSTGSDSLPLPLFSFDTTNKSRQRRNSTTISDTSCARFRASPGLDLSPPQKRKPAGIIIASTPTAYFLEESMCRDSLPPFSLDLKIDKDCEDNRWSRDNRVILHDGSHLIPYSFMYGIPNYGPLEYWLTTPHLNGLPKSIGNGSTETQCIGNGSTETQSAISYAHRSNIPFIQSRCCVEGGNIILFSDEREQRKAVIGTFSIVMSFLALTEQKAFDSPEFETHSKELDSLPLSDLFLIKARNYLLCQKGLKSHTEMIDFISPSERSNTELISSAKIIRAKWTYTQLLIAKELRIPLENIAWINQENFHIDLEVLVIENCAFVYDGEKTVELIDLQISRDLSDQRATLFEYRKKAACLAPYSKRLNEQNRSEFERIGLEMVPVAGRFEALTPSFPESRTINFFNGILLPSPKIGERVYAVGPCPYPVFYEKFFEVVRRSIPRGVAVRPLSVRQISPGNQRTSINLDYIGLCLTDLHGGLRCMTNTAPQRSAVSELPTTTPEPPSLEILESL